MFRRTHVILLAALTLVGSNLPVTAQEDEPYAPVIDPANFVEGVDHPYFPLTPGTTMVYEGETEEGIERIEVTTLPETKEILGIQAAVVRDTVWLDGELIEDTFDWFAQDKDGNVWYMGEESREYEDGEVVSTAGSWEAGVDGAQPGIIMKADPQIGDTYRQEYYVGEAEDMAEVINLDESAAVAYGAFDNLLVAKEWNPLEPGVVEHKYYAPGVGLVLEEVVEGGTGRVELVAIVTQPAGAEEDDGEGEEEAEETPSGTPIITVEEALQAAEAYLGDSSPHEVELEYEGGRWVYGIETADAEVTVDAISGEVLGSDADDE